MGRRIVHVRNASAIACAPGLRGLRRVGLAGGPVLQQPCLVARAACWCRASSAGIGSTSATLAVSCGASPAFAALALGPRIARHEASTYPCLFLQAPEEPKARLGDDLDLNIGFPHAELLESGALGLFDCAPGGFYPFQGHRPLRLRLRARGW